MLINVEKKENILGLKEEISIAVCHLFIFITLSDNLTLQNKKPSSNITLNIYKFYKHILIFK